MRLVRIAVSVLIIATMVVGCQSGRTTVDIVSGSQSVQVGEAVGLTAYVATKGRGCQDVTGRSRLPASDSITTWTVEPTSGATISDSGVFSARKPGTYKIRASVKPKDFPEASSSVTIVVHGEALEDEEEEELEPEDETSPGVLIMDNHNSLGVFNGGVSPVFKPTQTVRVKMIETYHWNDKQGAQSTGRISLRSADGETFGPFTARGVEGQGGVPNAYWQARMNIELQPGSYTIIDSKPATWSQNEDTGGLGMVRIYGEILD